MDDNVSTKSSDSLNTSGEYEIVSKTQMDNDKQEQNKSPTLKIANNGDLLDLQHDMTDAIKELEKDKADPRFIEIMNMNKGPMEIRAEILDAIADFKISANEFNKKAAASLKLQQKSLTLPLVTGSTKISSLNPNNIDGTAIATSPSVAKKFSTFPSGSENSLLAPSTSIQSIGVLSFKSDLLSPKSDMSTPDVNRVGHSVFYDCLDLSPAAHMEKYDEMKLEKSDTEEEISDIDQGCTIFSGVTYLGAANVNAPKSDVDIQKTMAELNSSSESVGLQVSVSIPTNSDGFIVLYDAETDAVVATYEIQRILFYARGAVGSNYQACFAFTWSHGKSPETAIFQCHIFRCHITEAVNQVSTCFQKAFQRYPPSLTGSVTSAVDSIMMASITSDVSGNPINSAGYEFIVSLEIREKMARSSYSAVPRDRGCFKLRCNTDKEVCITVKQTPSNTLQPLFIERCFGVLVSPGKLLRQADMQLLTMVSMGYLPSESTPQNMESYQIRAEWKANEKAFEQLNYESQKMSLTVAVDLVIKGIQEPVRFVIETPVTIQSQNVIRIMDHIISKRSMSLRFYLQLKKTDEASWEVSSIDPSEEIVEQTPPSSSLLKFKLNNLSKMVRSSSTLSIEDDCSTDYASDGDEPLLSGTGEVSKDCSQDTLDEWDPILKEWDSDKRPKNLAPLVRLGIPEALRDKIWQKLSNVELKVDMTDMYRTLITKETKCETVIQRDIHRTFPAHKCFKETGGSGQDSLFKVSKAYAVYDSEVGYCQGLSFIAASLLLHMPEEDAFCVLVSLMYDYGLRDLYKQGFEGLYIRLYQLHRLIRDHLPKLYEHFEENKIETHMFAAQWFLTLYTARFPLFFVFHVLDVFLLDGIPLLFQVALTLLHVCEAELRQLDFEGILKYLRVSLPKKVRSASKARKIMKMACERKIKKLKQYEEEYLHNKRNTERIEKETQIYEKKFQEERKRYQTDIKNLQKQLDEANEKAVQTEIKQLGIIQDYKQIIQRQEQQMTKLNDMLTEITVNVSNCDKCSSNIDSSSPLQTSFGNIVQPIKKQLSSDGTLGPLDPLNIALSRVRELELELAQTKLAQVEAECMNQDLNHQLNTTLTEVQSNRNGWQPWLSKTINSIQEKVTTRRDSSAPTFQSYMNPDSDNGEKSGNQDKVTSSCEHSPKFLNKYQNLLTRNSVDILPRERPIISKNLSLNTMK